MPTVGRYYFWFTSVMWNKKVNGLWQVGRALGDITLGDMTLRNMTLFPGDSFNITGHLHNDSLTLTVNEARVYSIPLGRLQDGIDGIDVSQSTILNVTGKVELTYINLISAC